MKKDFNREEKPRQTDRQTHTHTQREDGKVRAVASDSLHLGNEVVTDPGQLIILFSLLLHHLLQGVDTHLLLSQDRLQRQSVRLGLAADLGNLLACLPELLLRLGLQRLVLLGLLLYPLYVILDTLLQ